eukprot:gene4146-5905_t
MSFTIRAVELLKYDRFPKYQEAIADLDDFNPFACNLFISHKWITVDTADDGRYYRHFMNCLLRMINRCSYNKFLDEHRGILKLFDPEYIYDRTTGYDLFRQIIEPTEEDIFLLSQYLDTSVISVAGIADIFSFLNDINIWVDWTCFPQLPRTSEEDKLAELTLAQIHTIIENSYTICLWEGDEFERGWCMLEFLVSFRLRQVMFYPTEEYDLRQHQINALDTTVVTYFRTGSTLSNQASIIQQKPINFDFASDLEKIPPFIKQVLKLSDHSEILRILTTNNVKCSIKNDLSRVVEIYCRYMKKYDGFIHYLPEFMSRVPKDFRTKLINCLKNNFEGGEKIFNPVLFEYVSPPITKINTQKYFATLSNCMQEPFYSGTECTYFARVITTVDPVLLTLGCFTIPEMYGRVFNYDLNILPMTSETFQRFMDISVLDINNDIYRSFDKIRLNDSFDYSLSLYSQSSMNKLMIYKAVKDKEKELMVLLEDEYDKKSRGRSVLNNLFGRPYATRRIVLHGNKTLKYYNGNKLKGTIDCSTCKARNTSPPDDDSDKTFYSFLEIYDTSQGDKEVLIIGHMLQEKINHFIRIFNEADDYSEALWLGADVMTVRQGFMSGKGMLKIALQFNGYEIKFKKIIEQFKELL